MDSNDPFFLINYIMRFLTKFLVCKVFLYKCYYEHEHCLEEMSRNSCINIHQMEFHSVFSRPLVLFRLPLLLLKSHHPSTFFAISREIRVHTQCDQVLESCTANKPVCQINGL
ncbi:hypothetical protein T06_8731 [Trichinella sp. T6]|nr:hypothetical protein T06_8731 [Trichinella sp. T6]